jgi:hypothetical protein
MKEKHSSTQFLWQTTLFPKEKQVIRIVLNCWASSLSPPFYFLKKRKGIKNTSGTEWVNVLISSYLLASFSEINVANKVS